MAGATRRPEVCPVRRSLIRSGATLASVASLAVIAGWKWAVPILAG
jgi:hypothetical protein